MVLIDNMGPCFTVIDPDTNGQCSRHLDMCLFKIRDCIRARCARVVHIDTSDNIAGMFTKPLPKVSFRLFRDLLMCVAYHIGFGAFGLPDPKIFYAVVSKQPQIAQTT